MCRAVEQNASVYGHAGKPASFAVDVPEPPRAIPDTPNERLVTVLRKRARAIARAGVRSLHSRVCVLPMFRR